ncbi:MAG TPA: hypothetical protein GXX18_05420 [Bacillales bacterium]|nr:hypothetical protein [Bacillales bacterium]
MDDSHIMDLTNNCVGRAYPSKSSNYRRAFYTAKNNDELILSESSVTNWDYKYVWKNEWYTY